MPTSTCLHTWSRTFIFSFLEKVLITELVISSSFTQVHQEIEKIQKTINDLEQERAKSHKELGEYRSMTEVAMEVQSFSEELINFTDEASLKTDSLQKLMALAAKRKTNIQSGGTDKAVNSFKGSWTNITDIMDSNRIDILNDSRLVGIYESRYANTFNSIYYCYYYY